MRAPLARNDAGYVPTRLHTAWLPLSCSSSDMDAAFMSLDPAPATWLRHPYSQTPARVVPQGLEGFLGRGVPLRGASMPSGIALCRALCGPGVQERRVLGRDVGPEHRVQVHRRRVLAGRNLAAQRLDHGP